jgi:flagella basal body P-ring formation protein FlgA
MIVWVAAVWLAGAASAPAQPLRPSIMLKDTAVIWGTSIYLRDVASFAGVENRELAERLSEIKMGNSPLPGKARDINLDYVKIRLSQCGFNPAGFDFNGAASVKVSRAGRTIPSADIAAKAREYVLETMPWPAGEIVIDVERVPEDVVVAESGTVNITVQRRPNMDYLGKVQLSVRIDYGVGEYVTVPVSLNVRRFVDVAAACRNINRGAVVRADDIELKQMEVTNLPKDIAFDAGSVVGKRAKGFFVPGQPFVMHLLENMPLVKRQDRVIVRYETDTFVITAKAVARQDGCLGDRIRVRNIDSQKEFDAVVTGAGIVAAGPAVEGGRYE